MPPEELRRLLIVRRSANHVEVAPKNEVPLGANLSVDEAAELVKLLETFLCLIVAVRPADGTNHSRQASLVAIVIFFCRRYSLHVLGGS